MQLSDMAKKMIITILIVTSVCLIASVLYYRSIEFLPFMIGLTLGSAVSILKVFLLDRAVNSALTMEKDRAGTYVSLQHLLRLAISGVALVLGALVPQVSLWGVAAGIFAFQIGTYAMRYTSKS